MRGDQYSPEQNNHNHQTLVTSRWLGCPRLLCLVQFLNTTRWSVWPWKKVLSNVPVMIRQMVGCYSSFRPFKSTRGTSSGNSFDVCFFPVYGFHPACFHFCQSQSSACASNIGRQAAEQAKQGHRKTVKSLNIATFLEMGTANFFQMITKPRTCDTLSYSISATCITCRILRYNTNEY